MSALSRLLDESGYVPLRSRIVDDARAIDVDDAASPEHCMHVTVERGVARELTPDERAHTASLLVRARHT